jgi:hypothetical protein
MGSCEYDNGSSASMKDWLCTNHLSVYRALKRKILLHEFKKILSQVRICFM